jgi:N-acetylneuraminic acid mutarotase
MNKLCFLGLFLLLPCIVFAAALPELDPLPAPVTNNAVTTMKLHGDLYIFSLMGIGTDKTWNAVTGTGNVFDNDSGTWGKLHAVPGTAGRIDAMAAAYNGRVYLIGGSVVDAQGGEMPVPDLNIYAQDAEEWLRGADLPVAVSDAVIGIYHERYIYVIGGHSKTGAVNIVQVYDLSSNAWENATPMPGEGVFGNAGAILGDTIVYVDGANSAGGISNACWIGKIDHKNPLKISWKKLPAHPGQPGFRIAAGAWERDNRVYFLGGTPVPTNYKGEGSDGKVPEAFPMSFAFNIKTNSWEIVNPKTPHVRTGVHVLVPTEQGLVLVGGTESDGKVSAKIRIIPREKH